MLEGDFLTFGNGYTVYFAGSSAAMAEQALWAEMFKPHLVILHMGVRHDPVDFAMQARLLETGNRNIDAVMPHHHRAVQAQGTTSVADVQAAMRDMGVRTRLVAPQVGVSYTLVPPR